MPEYHRDRIDSVAGIAYSDDNERAEALTDVTLNTRVSANFLRELIDGVRTANPELPEPVVYARAAASYNGGPANASRDFSDFALESKLYVNHKIRITLDIAIAHELRQAGLDNDEILRAMQSNELNARAFAYSNYPRGEWDDYEYSAYLCSLPQPGVNQETQQPESGGQTVNNDYRSYLQSPSYSTPATGGLRIWLSGGGSGLFLQSEENANWTI